VRHVGTSAVSRLERSPDRLSLHRTLKARGNDRYAAESVSSVLPMVRRRRYPKAFHLVEQYGALQAESSGCSSRTPELPVGSMVGCENFSSHIFFKRRICNLWLQRLATLGWRWFKDAITRKDDTALNVVLQLSNVPRPGVTNLGAHRLLRDGFDGFIHRRDKVLHEVFHQFGDIGFPFAQRGQINRKSIQAVVQIFAEFAVPNQLLQVLVGGDDDANIDSRGARSIFPSTPSMS
jgi:hypothetical protein